MRLFNAFKPVRLAAPPAAPVEGATYYDTTLAKLGVYIGGTWVYLPGSGSAAPTFKYNETEGRADQRLLRPTLTDSETRADRVSTSPTLSDYSARGDAYRVPTASVKPAETVPRADRQQVPSIGVSDSERRGDLATIAVTYLNTGTRTFVAQSTATTVELWGGGGGAGFNALMGGGGGGGGEYAKSVVATVVGTSYPIVIPAGVGAGVAGVDGTFASTIVVAKGGGAGNAGSATAQGSGGGGGTTGTGTTRFPGGTGGGTGGALTNGAGGGGGAGSTQAGSVGLAAGTGGAGGSQNGGAGGTGGTATTPGTVGLQAGGGGGGANQVNNGQPSGPGLARITFSI